MEAYVLSVALELAGYACLCVGPGWLLHRWAVTVFLAGAVLVYVLAPALEGEPVRLPPRLVTLKQRFTQRAKRRRPADEDDE